MAVQGVVVEIHLAVQGDDIVLRGDDQGIDLHQGTVVVDGQVVQVFQQHGKGLHAGLGHIEPESRRPQVVA
jgi:formylmethanofuran dehydrogenase subunit C